MPRNLCIIYVKNTFNILLVMLWKLIKTYNHKDLFYNLHLHADTTGIECTVET